MNNQESIKIHFLGAAGVVTGSKYLIDTGKHKILVDCGLFQGLKKLRMLNWEELPVNVAEIDVLLLTHAHLDHSGYIPKLLKSGFKKKIMGTKPTLEVAEIILLDSAKIQEEDAERANKEGFSKHKPAKPLYNIKDAERAIDHFYTVPEGEWIDLFEGIQVRFQYVGHIIGATFIELDIYGKRFVFSGDVGRKDDQLMRTYKKPQKADILFVESTYGDRLHHKADIKEVLKEIIIKTVDRGGTLIIPSFAVERAQLLMYLLWQLKEAKEIPNIPMIMDSPMGANVLNVFKDNLDWHKLSRDECTDMVKAFQIVKEYKETWEVIDNKDPKIIIAGSGMVTGGRVLTYLQQYVDLPETTVLLVGFQAEGTRGRKLLDGAYELKIYGKYYPVKAEINSIQILSAHGDQAELLDWMSDINNKPERVFLIHGEPHSSDAFRLKIKDTYNWDCTLPELYTIVEIPFTENESK